MAGVAKEALKTELATRLRAELVARERLHRATVEGATHAEAKPENDKDTRALEQSYLARGEAMRVEEMRQELADIEGLVLRVFGSEDPAALGALVTAEEDGSEVVLWLSPAGGGEKLAGGAVRVVTPKSPLGRTVLGKRAGDECEVVLAGKTRALSILRVE